MLIKLNESKLNKLLSEIFYAIFRQEKSVAADNKAIKKASDMESASLPDATWHRSKSARFRQN